MISKKGYRPLWIAAVVLLSGPAFAQQEFPIGAWFPGMQGDNTDPTPEEIRVWEARLDSVKAQGFNTIHARQGRGYVRTSAYNQRWMALAHARGLKVQLHSWRQPTAWRTHSRNYWTRTFEAEDTEIFTHAIGKKVTDGDRVAQYRGERRQRRPAAGLGVECSLPSLPAPKP